MTSNMAGLTPHETQGRQSQVKYQTGKPTFQSLSVASNEEVRTQAQAETTSAQAYLTAYTQGIFFRNSFRCERVLLLVDTNFISTDD